MSILGRTIRLPLRLIPKTAVVPILQGPLQGKRWIVGSGVHGYWVGCYEAAKQAVFHHALTPQSVVYNIGANVGFYTLLAAQRARQVYAFEPLPENIGYLATHMELNKITNANILDFAVGAMNGNAAFDVNGNRGEGHLAPNGSVRVAVTRSIRSGSPRRHLSRWT